MQRVRGKPDATGDLAVLILLAIALFLLHTLTNGRYGFHRDELSTLEDARALAWGYVGVPPVTPFLAYVATTLFGPSLVGLRVFSSLAMSVALVLTGLMARHMGGSRFAQIVAALGAAISSVALSAGSLFQYVSLDYLCWVAAAYCMVRVLASDDPRAFIGVGIAVGLGLLTKYTMSFLAAGIVAGVLLTSARRHLRSPWLWGGVALAGVIVLPHLVWQIRHDFISLDFLESIHQRDVALGRTAGFLSGQLWIAASPFTLPLWLAGLYSVLIGAGSTRFRAIGWMFVVPLVLFMFAHGRDYYMAPAYPMLLAAGAVSGVRAMAALGARRTRVAGVCVWTLLAFGGVLGAAPVLPVAPLGSAWWRSADRLNGGNFNEELGWPELAQAVVRVRDALPAEQRANAGILAADSAQVAALRLYGARDGLPPAISGTNTNWFRGYGNPPPQPLIVVGVPDDFVQRELVACRIAGHADTPLGIANSSMRQRDIYICDAPRQPWPAFWRAVKRYG
ncbi:glycosyltransferase family 39 protein [Caballeronia sp. LZ035]|uniref:glycosyltransferase family 39 protein n=1 Tax=Caballeronia sp. LZ035 TaxID=3038568 RepID=UPI00285B7EA4|nr:glycosyltransferase family 39 protein [Caballeronia sp. LZ035]MDR5759798.1 glycosyltransferase family 39 protein [Caballeronia sp. LZ035]